MSGAAFRTTFLEEYTPPDFLVDEVALTVHLDPDNTRVRSRLQLRRNPGAADRQAPLRLDGQELTLEGIALDGVPLSGERYRLDADQLTIPDLPDQAVLEIETTIHPAENSALEGLYQSGGLLCTQCEAEGFRKITCYPDRPDVMARFTTTLIADPLRYPLLLANGNLVSKTLTKDGKQAVTWVDPFPKPAYLFALVAGDLVCRSDRFTTASGRTVDLHLYVEPENGEKCAHALASLKKAMAWDEARFGREYDLDIYMIVAVGDFNMGAMENKGLNLFNAKYVLADPQTATDSDFHQIEAVIAHEYFHNWTGNRITCRDWFQLSLKEGLTVFRDHLFSADTTAPSVQRIREVRLLRDHQFPEDAGPTAHPVRPDSYVEINNFYTMTVYEKGAEVVRMLYVLLGEAGFRAGMDIYFQRHDGQAVTVEAFIQAMEAANGVDLGQFMGWYRQAGTPRLSFSWQHDPVNETLELVVRQSCPPTPGQPEKQPLHLPLVLGLLDGGSGAPLPVRLAGEPRTETARETRTLELRRAEERFVFTGLPTPPIPSLLRGFSAPVIAQTPHSDADLAFLWRHDPDPFNRWDAGQTLATRSLMTIINGPDPGGVVTPEPGFLDAFAGVLRDERLDPALAAMALTLPSESSLLERMTPADPQAVHDGRESLRRALATALRDDFLACYHRHACREPYRHDPQASGRRALKNLSLACLLTLDEPEMRRLALAQFQNADNMTDRLGALVPLVHGGGPEGETALAVFFETWKDDPLVMDKWFTVQATNPQPGGLERVVELMAHPLFTRRNPNRVRAVIGAFCAGNPAAFHHPSGNGYRFLANQVLTLDRTNPQIAARLLTPLKPWRRFEPNRKAQMRAALERVHQTQPLSRDVHEMAMKSLGSADG